MATRNNAKFTDDTVDTDDTASEPMPKEYTATDQDTDAPGLSTEDIDNMSFDSERSKREELERAKIDPPAGDWLKQDRWKYEKRVNSQDSQAGDVDAAGRTMLTFAGRPQAKQANGVEYEPMLFVRISPDIRYKEDEPNKTDLAYRLWLKAKDLYLSLHDEQVTTFRQIRNMLEDDEYLVRTMKGDNGPIVIDIKPKVVKRR